MKKVALACLFDMDGVVRHWNPAWAAGAERAYGLPTGALRAAAFALPEYEASLRGEATFTDWVLATERFLRERYGGAADAVRTWHIDKGEVDTQVMALIGRTRRFVPVGILSNAHGGLRDDLTLLGIRTAFDVVVCSAEVGVVKPDVAIYQCAADALGLIPQQCFFTDDLKVNVAGAKDAGMDAVQFTGAAQLATQWGMRLWRGVTRRGKGSTHLGPL